MGDGNVAWSDNGCASAAACRRDKDGSGLRNQRFHQSDCRLGSLVGSTLARPAHGAPAFGPFDQPPQRRVVLNEDLSWRKRLEDSSKLFSARRGIGAQKAFDQVGFRLLLKALKRID